MKSSWDIIMVVGWIFVAGVLISAYHTDDMVSEQIPVPNQDPEVVTVIEYSNLVKDCVWEDPCEFVEAAEYHQKVKWLMEHHRMQTAMLNGYWEDETCSID